MIRLLLAALVLAAALTLNGKPARADVFLYVRDGIHLNARLGPGTGYRPYRVLRPGTRLRYLARRGNWARVETPEGLILWVFLSYLVNQAPQHSAPRPPIVIIPAPVPRYRIVPRSRPPRWIRPRPPPRRAYPWPHPHFPPHHPGRPYYPGR